MILAKEPIHKPFYSFTKMVYCRKRDHCSRVNDKMLNLTMQMWREARLDRWIPDAPTFVRDRCSHVGVLRVPACLALRVPLCPQHAPALCALPCRPHVDAHAYAHAPASSQAHPPPPRARRPHVMLLACAMRGCAGHGHGGVLQWYVPCYKGARTVPPTGVLRGSGQLVADNGEGAAVVMRTLRCPFLVSVPRAHMLHTHAHPHTRCPSRLCSPPPLPTTMRTPLCSPCSPPGPLRSVLPSLTSNLNAPITFPTPTTPPATLTRQDLEASWTSHALELTWHKLLGEPWVAEQVLLDPCQNGPCSPPPPRRR